MKQWKIAWRNLMRRKSRTFLTILSIIIGVASTFSVIAAVDSAEKSFPIFIKEAFAKADFNIAGTEAYFSEDVYEEVDNIENATAVAVLKENTKLLVEDEGISSIQKRVVVTGYSKLDTAVTGFKLIEGDLKKEGAVITDKTAKIWESNVGDTFKVETDRGVKEIEITAIVKYTQELMGPSSWSMAKYHHWAVALPLPVVQEWFDLDGKIQGIQVKGSNPESIAAVETAMDEVVKGHSGIFMQPVVVNIDEEFQKMDSFFLALYIAGFLGIVLSAFIIFNSLYVSMKERKNEFAVLKTIGYTPGQLQVMVLTEVILLALIGTGIGLLVGYGMALGLSSLVFMLIGIRGGSSMVLLPGIVLSLIAGLVVPVVAAWFPIRNVGRISVIQVLKDNQAKAKGTNKWFGIIGVGLIISSFFINHLLLVLPLLAGIALIFPYLFKLFVLFMKGFYGFVFRFSGDMALRNLNRNLSRSSMTSVILCLGIAMIVLMSSLNSALLQTYEKVIHSTYGGNLDIMFHHIEEGDLETIKETKGVVDATTYSLQSMIWTLDDEKRMLPVYGVGEYWIDRFPLFTGQKGTHSDLIKNLKSDEVVLDEISYGVWGGSMGETITLDTQEGPKPFKVVAVVNTMKNQGFAAFMKDDHFKESFGVKYEKNALVVKDEKTSPLQLRENIYGQFGERVEEMWGPEDWVSVIGSMITSSFSIINALVVLAIIISGIGITNTLLINIMERVREIGMMRAVGITRKQIIKMILLEGFGIGLAATVVGILVGILLIYMTSDFMEYNSMTFEFGVSNLIIGLIFLFGIIVSLVSSFTPSRRAAKIPLNEALRYE
ncbi:FtsX-like permease family protein [Bacillus sp. 31A1R]|uniref:FtsX-like permease family protein n=1 Tax=Robertmurraya mangrovi TaxID=3098077 RepID=A0ABU5J1T0_9BACI|nr:FtsX-like permease family protein [Bacillus sp. 31A1R]MDZ5473349.1 FtsX-like permease family protein [Bacillus sp. 31A1R]